MKLNAGETIFDKMNTSYDNLRTADNPVGEIVKYYKSQLKEGEGLWWIDNTGTDTEASHSMKVKLWRTLSSQTKRDFMVKGFAYFPEVMGNGSSTKKYERFTLWLVSNHGIVSTSMRDSFSAGGRGEIELAVDPFDRMEVSRAVLNISKNSINIAACILNANEKMLCETWRVDKVHEDRMGQWIDLCASHNHCIPEKQEIQTALSSIFNRLK
jgi:hypothetical protein